MGMKRQKLSEPIGAPPYMAQYTALMTILLTFFITMLTMAKEKESGFRIGIGSIRDALGIKGALGLLPFWSNMRTTFTKTYPKVKEQEKDEMLIGYSREMTWEDMYADVGYLRTEYINRGVGLKIPTPIVFAEGRAAMDKEAKRFMDRIGGILYSLPEVVLTVRSLCTETGDEVQDQLLATKRAAALVRYLEQRARISRDRMRAVGYAHALHIEPPPEGAKQTTLLMIHKYRTQIGSPEADVPGEET
ncbi:MAG: OmpA family protein [Kiritimatiellae bacterium]|nr:OmpA family protein [Kiritimatiellia bacterium]